MAMYERTGNKRTDIQRVNKLIAESLAEVNKRYTDIGRLVKLRCVDQVTDPEVLSLIADVDARLFELRNLQEELNSLNGVKTCPNCNATIDINVAFCPSCGTRQTQANTQAQTAYGQPQQQYAQPQQQYTQPQPQPYAQPQNNFAPPPQPFAQPVAPAPIPQPAPQPVVPQPVAPQPVAPQPAFEQPVMTQPVMEPQPVVEQPVAEPAFEQPVAEPVFDQPVMEQPVVEEAPAVEEPVSGGPAWNETPDFENEAEPVVPEPVIPEPVKVEPFNMPEPPAAPAEEPLPSAAPQQSFIFCTQCGSKEPADTRFCSQCGTMM